MSSKGVEGMAEVLSQRLAKAGQQGLRRSRHAYTPSGVMVEHDAAQLINFSGNDYLDLKQHPKIKQALIDGVERYGAGSGASALVSGYCPAHQQLEQAIAAFTHRPAAIVYSSGYLANLAVTAALLGRHDTIIEDRLNHASLLDAGRLSAARLLRYRHADMDSLQQQLEQPGQGQRLVMTDGVFFMDGDTAKLAEIAGLCAEYNAWLMVDDAHGIGIAGPQGRGSVLAAGLDSDQVPVLVGTFGKAFGSAGAFVAGSLELIDALQNWGRSGIYSTAMPPAQACATMAALDLVEQGAGLRRKLRDNIQHFRVAAGDLELPLLPSTTPIQPLMAGEPETALAWGSALRETGLLVTPIRPPTVPVGAARLRITLSAGHSHEQIDQLLESLGACR